MHKNLIIFPIDSIVDIITNSSSELFICSVEKESKFVEEILRSILKDYCKKNKRLYNNNTFKATFGDIICFPKNFKLTPTTDLFLKIEFNSKDSNKKEKNNLKIKKIKEILETFDGYSDYFEAIPNFKVPNFWDFKKTNPNPISWNPEFTEKERKLYFVEEKKLQKQFKKEYDNWFELKKDEIFSYFRGKVFIFSKGDNSIPYELFEEINNKLNGFNIHLG